MPKETVEAWKVALTGQDDPCAIILSRQGLPVIDPKRYASVKGLTPGAMSCRTPSMESRNSF